MKNFKIAIFALSLLTISCASDSTSDVEEPSNNITYTNTIQPLMSQSCNVSGCHNSTTKASGLDLSTFNLVKAAFANTGSSSAIGRIESGNMPQGGSKLSATTIANLKTWISDNFPQ